jgi:hypothetical protein
LLLFFIFSFIKTKNKTRGARSKKIKKRSKKQKKIKKIKLEIHKIYKKKLSLAIGRWPSMLSCWPCFFLNKA